MATRTPSLTPERKERYRRLVRKFRANPKAMFGLSIVVMLIIVAIFADYIAIHPIEETNIPNREQPPSFEHPMGTDDLGRDIFSRIVMGVRISLYVGITSIAGALVLGTAMGVLAGYRGGWTDELLMRLVDAMMSFPPVLLALAIVAVAGANLTNLVIALAFVYTPYVARVARSAAISVRNEAFVDAAIVRGESEFYVMGREVLPNCAGPLLVQGSINVSFAILIEASLSFLGLGVQPPTPSWGIMVNTGWPFMADAPWMVLFPAGAIALAVIGFNMLGDGIRDVLDPQGEIIE